MTGHIANKREKYTKISMKKKYLLIKKIIEEN